MLAVNFIFYGINNSFYSVCSLSLPLFSVCYKLYADVNVSNVTNVGVGGHANEGADVSR